MKTQNPTFERKFSGFTDSTGKDIFSGDICIRRLKWISNVPFRFIVKYSSEKSCFIAIDTAGGSKTYLSDYLTNQYTVEVIGNIFDTPTSYNCKQERKAL